MGWGLQPFEGNFLGWLMTIQFVYRRVCAGCCQSASAAAAAATAAERLAFDGELSVYDHKRRRLLRDGDYELVLYDASIEKSDIREEWSVIKEVRPSVCLSRHRRLALQTLCGCFIDVSVRMYEY